MEDAVVSHPTESFGENVLHNEVQKVLSIKRFIAHSFCFAFNVAEGDLTVLVGNDILFTDDTPIQVS